MTRLLDMIIVVILLACLLVQTAWSGPAFIAPSISSAGNIAYPTNVATPVIVTLMVNLDSSGNVQNLEVLRDVPSVAVKPPAEPKGCLSAAETTAAHQLRPFVEPERFGP